MSDSMSVYGDGLFWVSPWIDDLPEIIKTREALRWFVYSLPENLYEENQALACQVQEAVDACLKNLEIPDTECEVQKFPETIWLEKSQYGMNIRCPRKII